jgi:hypothetical protein
MTEYSTNGILEKPQNYFNDKPTIQISQIPLINLAYISNSNISENSITSYCFNVIQLNYSDFKTCFFDSILNNFNISFKNAEVQALSLYQNYMDTTNNNQKFNLNNAVLYAWAEKNSATSSSISVKDKITLNKNTLMTRSIGSFLNVQNALSWNQAIQSLLESGDIVVVKGNTTTCAVIDFQIVVQYTYVPLGVSIDMFYTYRVNVPGYANKAEPNPCYSNDSTPARTTFDFKLNEYNHYNMNNKLDNIPEEFNENSSQTSHEVDQLNNEKLNNNNYFIDDNTNDVISIMEDTVANESKVW